MNDYIFQVPTYQYQTTDIIHPLLELYRLVLNKDHLARTTVYKSSYALYQDVKETLPYPTLPSYDGKIWEFKKDFRDGDYIWNVAGIHKNL
jgi:hypothetical protein